MTFPVVPLFSQLLEFDVELSRDISMEFRGIQPIASCYVEIVINFCVIIKILGVKCSEWFVVEWVSSMFFIYFVTIGRIQSFGWYLVLILISSLFLLHIVSISFYSKICFLSDLLISQPFHMHFFNNIFLFFLQLLSFSSFLLYSRLLLLQRIPKNYSILYAV